MLGVMSRHDSKKGELLMESASIERILEDRPGAASFLNISLRTLERLIEAKRIKVVRVGRRVLVERRALQEFVRKNAQ